MCWIIQPCGNAGWLPSRYVRAIAGGMSFRTSIG
jgi:hypothetical protein